MVVSDHSTQSFVRSFPTPRQTGNCHLIASGEILNSIHGTTFASQANIAVHCAQIYDSFLCFNRTWSDTIILVQQNWLHSHSLATMILPCPQNSAWQKALAPSQASPLVSIVTMRGVQRCRLPTTSVSVFYFWLTFLQQPLTETFVDNHFCHWLTCRMTSHLMSATAP